MTTDIAVEKLILPAIERHVVTCERTATLKDVTVLMHQRHCSSVVVVERDKPIGIWTEADSLKIDFSDSQQSLLPISALMSTALQTIKPNITLDEAALAFKRLGIRHFIVVDDSGCLFGILSQSDVVKHQDAEYFLNMTEVSSLMTHEFPPTVDIDALMTDVVDVMKAYKSDSVVITQYGEPSGLITERDLVRLIALDRLDAPIALVMSKPLISVPKTMSLLAARSLMEKRHIRHLGVNDGAENFIGLISFSDILSNIEHTYVKRLRDALIDRSADLKETEQSLHMAHALIDASMDGIMVTNEQGLIQSINPAFSILTGYSESEALGQSASLISSGMHDGDFYRRMWDEINARGSWQGEIWNRRKNGEVFPEWLTITRIKEPRSHKLLYAGIFSDITERKKSEEIIENLAYYDPLTKLPNRQLLSDRLEVAIASAHREKMQLAVMFIDLDHFKRINDSLGHSVGDKVLCAVANRIKATIREGDTLARLGGDELILLLTELDDPDVAFRAAQRIFDELQLPIDVDGLELFVSASLGCSIYPNDGINSEELLKNADTAMYRAKNAGRNGFRLYSSEMNEKSKVRLELENRLRTALSNNEFFLVYQPKVLLSTGEIIGVEALIRWQDKIKGLVAPDQFIPLAEDLGLIDEIGAWVLKEATMQGCRWIEQGLKPLKVSVNVSAQQFKAGNLISNVEQALCLSGFEAAMLDLEITESCVLEDVESVLNILSHFRTMGISISMDDFGTGFSSLSMLTRLPLDYLKIDRSFMQGIPGKKDDEVLASTIVLMAHNLGFGVVAEGVETIEQQIFLNNLGCRQAQGYFFSRPVQASEVNKMLCSE